MGAGGGGGEQVVDRGCACDGKEGKEGIVPTGSIERRGSPMPAPAPARSPCLAAARCSMTHIAPCSSKPHMSSGGNSNSLPVKLANAARNGPSVAGKVLSASMNTMAPFTSEVPPTRSASLRVAPANTRRCVAVWWPVSVCTFFLTSATFSVVHVATLTDLPSKQRTVRLSGLSPAALISRDPTARCATSRASPCGAAGVEPIELRGEWVTVGMTRGRGIDCWSSYIHTNEGKQRNK
jgi:hypothetical protein